MNRIVLCHKCSLVNYDYAMLYLINWGSCDKCLYAPFRAIYRVPHISMYHSFVLAIPASVMSSNFSLLCGHRVENWILSPLLFPTQMFVVAGLHRLPTSANVAHSLAWEFFFIFYLYLLEIHKQEALN